MPIYEYKCRKCGQVTELIEGAHDDPLKKCPSCAGKVERMMSAGAFILKGTGWYATDYGTRSHDSGNGNGNGKGKGKGKPKEKAKEAGEASCPAASGSEAPPACASCPKLD
ncbi:MAG: FmdB family zinc ribbon protein [bacterium]|jgi:putative FmdB family regulatory protein